MSGVEVWGGDAQRAAEAAEDLVVDDHGCGATCQACVVKNAGAVELARSLGMDFATETPEAREQLRHLAGHVYSAMSEAILTLPGISQLYAGRLGSEGVLPPEGS